MLRFIGGWDNRSDSLPSCAERVRLSLELMPAQDDVYGPWGVWRIHDEQTMELVPVDVDDVTQLEREILTVTERVNDGPMRQPGQHIAFARRLLGALSDPSTTAFKYTVRAGFVGRAEPYNHVVLQVESGTDASVLTRYMSALVVAWNPATLALATRETQRAQDKQPSEAIVGWLTYIRAGTRLDTELVDDQVAISNADGGRYITVPGTPEDPSLDHIRQVRRALGYAD